MTIKTNILLIMTFVTISTKGQNHIIGIKLGGSLTSITDNNYFNDKTPKLGFSGGVLYECVIKNKIIFGADLIYNQRGFGNYYIFGDKLDPNKGFISGGGREIVYFQYDYLSIPLKIGYSYGKKLFGFGFIGISPSYLLDSQRKDEDNLSINYTDDVKRYDLSGLMEIGCGYRIIDSWDTFAMLTYQQSFTTISTTNYFAGGNIKIFGLTASLGVKYRLTEK